MNDYQAAWAYLQGAIEALTPLIPHLAPDKLQERFEQAIAVGRGFSAMAQMPVPEQPVPDVDSEIARRLRQATGVPEASNPQGLPGSVFFPHDLERTGLGTFTRPEPTEEEIEELLRQRETGQQ